MRATTSLYVILVAAILGLGNGAYLVEDDRDAQRGKTGDRWHSWPILLMYILPLLPTANNEEMEDIQRALNQLNADAAAEAGS